MTETRIAFTELLGRRVRMGSWEDQKISTYQKIRDALDAGAWDEAGQLESYFIDEANVCFTLYRQWIGDLTGFLRDGGVDEATIEARNEQLRQVAVAARRLAVASAQALGSLPLRDAGRHSGDLPRAVRAGQGAAWPRPRRRGGRRTTATSTTPTR